MNPPDFTLDKIKFATDKPTFEKAVQLYESGKVIQVEEGICSYRAIVQGTKPYRVSVEARRYDYGHCTCYLGQNDTLCKHMVSLALYVVKDGQPLTDEDKKVVHKSVCSSKLGALNNTKLADIKHAITASMHYIKSYEGSSRSWFAYQDSLSEGCNRLAAIISDMPVSESTSGLLVKLLIRLDKKLCTGGVDDSDGTVGGFIEEVVIVLQEYAKLDSGCFRTFAKLENRETCFGWEQPLLKITYANRAKSTRL